MVRTPCFALDDTLTDQDEADEQYVNLGYPIASTVVASIALLLAAAPLLLLRYGKTLRAKSPVTSALEAAARDQR
jgi:hypothetical protein